ncbi:MAG TPA: serine/threonine-protein kinase, partial [Kofleriaceae bacterium]|nr:serine/threonine-protein kinase [Kofleriaceae bacterium]
ERDGRLPWRDAVDVLRGVLLGLRHAHDRGVVHRDIKPDNVYLARKDGDLIIKILDFGIAKLRAGTADDPASTRAGITVGTPAYLSPEQAVGGEITPASDLYSASIVLYEMLTGRAPFEDKDPLAMLGAHVSRTPPRFAEVAPDVELPQGLEDVMRAGLAKPAAERTRLAKDYLALLDKVVASARRYRTAPVAAVSPTAATAELAAVAAAGAGARAAGRVTPLPGAPAITSPSSAPDQSLVIEIGQSARAAGAATVSAEHELPPQARAVSLAELSETIPRKWIVIGGIVVVLLIIGAIILAVGSSGDYKPSSSSSTGLEGSAPGDPAAARDLALKALLLELQNGKTCAARKAAIAPLVAFGDARAIEPLRAARQRTSGGSGSAGAEDHNGCLVREADAAIKALSR